MNSSSFGMHLAIINWHNFTPSSTGIVAGGSSIHPYLWRFITDLFHLLQAVQHGIEALVYNE